MSATHTTDCTYCGANAGAPCRTATGNRANRPHAARTNATPATTEPATAPAENHNTPHPAARRITATGTVANRRCGDGITRTVIELDTGDRIIFETGSATAENHGLRAGDRVTFTATVTRSRMDRYEIFDHHVIDFRPAVQDDDKTFTLDDVAIAAARRAGIPTRDALAAAEACIHRIGKHSGRIIDPDGITENDADFLIGAIQFDHVTGDLVPA